MQRFAVPRLSTCVLTLIAAIGVFPSLFCAPTASAQASSAQYLYMAEDVPNGQGSNVPGIVTYTVNPTTGALTQITQPPVQTRAQLAASLAINNAGTFVFAAALNSSGQGSVEVFSAASAGSLAEITNSPFGISNPQATPVTIAVSPNGNYVYVASTVPANESGPSIIDQSTIVDVFAVEPDGSLTLSATYPFATTLICNSSLSAPLTPVQFYVHPTQKWLFLFLQSSYGEGCSGQPSQIQPFTINDDGTLAPGTPEILPLFATDGYALTGTPDGSELFVMTRQNSNNEIIYGVQIDPNTGDMSLSYSYGYPGLGPPPALSIGGLAADSTSSYLYSSAGTFQLQDGMITAINDSTSPFIGGALLLASPILPFVFGDAEGSFSAGPLYAEQVNGDGSLTAAPGSPYNIITSAMTLSGSTPIPTKAVMWLAPDTPISISNIVVGQTGTGQFSILNQGYGPLTISSVSLTGDPSLTVLNNCTSPVAPGGMCGVGATFAPTSVGTFTGTLTIVSSVGTRTLSISATSIAPFSQPSFNAPSPILFPDTATGSSSPLTYTLSNLSTATASLTVSSVTITGSNPGDFSQTNSCTAASPLAPGASCSVTVTFAPQALGSRAGTLNINGPTGAEVQSSLTGTGVTTVTKYNLNIGVTGPGTITQSPTGTSLPNNTTVTLTAVPNANSSFMGWGAACASSGSTTCTLIITGNTNVTATFATNLTFNLVVVGSGTVSQQPTGNSFAPGTTVVVSAFPNSGQQFVGYTPSSACTAGEPANVCYATLSANLTLTATFTSTGQYTLVANTIGSGSITQSPAGTSFAPNTPITLTAVPSAGNAFASWYLGPCNGSTNPVCSFNISANTTTTAEFEPGYTLTAAVQGPGTITQSPAGTIFVGGTTITLTATPNAGAIFQGWFSGGCTGSTNTTCMFTLTQNTTVTATFAAAPQYTLATTASGPGTVTQSPTGTSFASGTAITLTAVPNTGATFTSWSGGACSGSTSTTCTFNISANTSVTATFAGAPAVTVPNPSQSGSAGSAFTFALSTSGFSTPPTLKASCAIPEGTCTISGTTLTVTTTAAPARAIHETAAWIAAWPGDSAHDGLSSGVGARTSALRAVRVALVAMLALMLAAFATRLVGTSSRRMRLAFAPLAMFAMVAGLALLAACGGGGGGGGGGQTGTPAGTYTVTVTATAGTQTATTNVSVTIQ